MLGSMAEQPEAPNLDLHDYREIFHNASDGLLIHPPDSGTIIDVNKRFAEMVGYSREELLQMSVTDLTADDWDPEMTPQERVRQAREQGQIKFEWRDQRKDGTAFWVEVNLTPIRLQGTERVLSSVRDISERKRQARRSRAIFDQTYQFTGLMAPDGTLLEANQTALDFGDLDRDDVVGKPFWECYWWQLSEETQQRVKRSVERAASGEFVRYDVEVQGAEGTEIIDFSIRPICDEQGQVRTLIPEGRLITDQRRRRQRLDVYNRVMRHNLRNKLSVVNGLAAEISESTDDPEIESLSESVLEAGNRLRTLSERIRSFDKLKQNETTYERVDVNGLLSSLTGRYESVSTVIDDDIDLYSDATYLRLALEQLIENALEHTDGAVEVAAWYEHTSPQTVCISVRDDGPGIPTETLRPVLDDETTQLDHTVGIGIWLTKWCVDELGAELDFRTDDDGTHARIRVQTRS